MENYTVPNEEEKEGNNFESVDALRERANAELQTNIDEIVRLSRAVGDRPEFGFEDDLEDTIKQTIETLTATLEEIKNKSIKDAGQGNLEL